MSSDSASALVQFVLLDFRAMISLIWVASRSQAYGLRP
jgi:hypothetical protein